MAANRGRKVITEALPTAWVRRKVKMPRTMSLFPISRKEKLRDSVLACLDLTSGRNIRDTRKANWFKPPIDRKVTLIPKFSVTMPPIRGPNPKPLKKAPVA